MRRRKLLAAVVGLAVLVTAGAFVAGSGRTGSRERTAIGFTKG